MQGHTTHVAKAVVKFLNDKGYIKDPMEVFEVISEVEKIVAGTFPQGAAASQGSTPAQGAAGASSSGAAPDSPKPAVDPTKSVNPDYLICLEDGQRVVLLRRHLKTRYNMTPDQYRVKWGLPSDYPMVSPNFAKRKSEFARTTGFGRSHRPQFKEHYDQVKKDLGVGSAGKSTAPAGETAAAEEQDKAPAV